MRPVYMVVFAFISFFAMSSRAYAVCEELWPQLFGKHITFTAASTECREYILKHVVNQAYRSTLIEACLRRPNYARKYRNSLYQIAHKCVDKQSADWLQRHYNRQIKQELETWRNNITYWDGAYCDQKIVKDYIKESITILDRTVEDAKKYCN